MKEFVSLLLSFIFIGVADSIDAAFNNAISIDVLVVCGCLVSVEFILMALGNVSLYTYRVTRTSESKYLVLQAIISTIIGIFCFMFGGALVRIFELSDTQRILFINLLKLYAVYLPAGRVANALFEMVRLRNHLKLYKRSLVYFYILLITLDGGVFIFTKNIYLLFIATIVARGYSIIYMSCKLRLKFEMPDREILNSVVKYGIPMLLERMVSRVFILSYIALANRMGTYKYSVFTVCYAVALKLESITDAYNGALMVYLSPKDSYEKQLVDAMSLKKQCFTLMILLDCAFSGIYLLILHGSLPLRDCFPYILVYCCSIFGLYMYETYYALCIMQAKPKILLVGSVTGSLLKVICCFIFYKTSIGLYMFGLANMLDFFVRGVIFKVLLERSVGKRKESRDAEEMTLKQELYE